MKVSIFLQKIFTTSFLLERPNTSIQNHNDIIFELELPDNYTNNKFNDLPINFNTIKNMMLMSYNAYLNTDNSNWKHIDYDLNGDISISPNDIKGYLFSDETKTYNIVAIKGTTISLVPMFLSIFDNTIPHDKFNDNLFFSCCFYKESKLFNNYCNDKNSTKNQCKKSCYIDSINIHQNYLSMIDVIIDNIKKHIDFENSNTYFTGHSLGGFLAVILGLKYDKQVIAFDSPGGKHYIDLLDINYNNDSRIYHFGHNADSIMHGHCGALCWAWGYNIKTKCRIGNSCIYDSKKKLGISDSIYTHQLNYLINNILPHWENDFPQCKYHEKCEERCNKWKFI
jgi:lipase ATG15